MKFAAKKDDAVSPVIGTILLVAITVVLVAIIAAVVMPMVGGMNATHVTGVQVDTNARTVTFNSGEVPTKIIVSGAKIATADGSAGTGAESIESTTDAPIKIGSKYYLIGAEKGKEYAVNIVGKYSDGSEQVIWSGKITQPSA